MIHIANDDHDYNAIDMMKNDSWRLLSPGGDSEQFLYANRIICYVVVKKQSYSYRLLLGFDVSYNTKVKENPQRMNVIILRTE